jgi:plasmid stability protein
VDATIRNIDDDAFRALKAYAAAHGMTVGEAVTRMIRSYVRGPNAWPKTRSIAEFPHEHWGPGNEHVSDEIDKIVYGI